MSPYKKYKHFAEEGAQVNRQLHTPARLAFASAALRASEPRKGFPDFAAGITIAGL
jgi:hypothetical protein